MCKIATKQLLRRASGNYQRPWRNDWKGYTYAFQLLGYLLWETGAETLDDQVLDQVLPTYRYQLYRNVYTKIYQELSPIDRQFILAMAQVNADEVAIGQIRQAL